MLRSQLRLELLKLTFTHARSPEEALAKAMKLEKFILEKDESEEVKDQEPKKTSALKKVDNAKISN